MKNPVAQTQETFTESDILQMEQRFVDRYYSGDGQHPIRTLLRLYKGQYHHLVLSSLCFLIKEGALLYMPVATANVLDAVVAGGENFWPVMFENIGLLLGLLCFNIPFHILYVRQRSMASRAVEAGLRGAVVKKLQQLTIRFHTEMQSGRIQSKIIRDVDNIHGMFEQVFNSLLSVGINMAFVLGVLIAKANLAIIIFYLISVPAAIIISRLFLKNFRRKNRAFRKEMEATSSQVVDMVEMIPVTRAHALQDAEVNKMNDRVQHLASRGLDLDQYGALFGSVNWSTIQLFSIICLVFSCYLAYTGKITVGDVTLYSSYFSRFIGYVSTILSLIPVIASGAEAITSVGEILAAEDVEENEGKQELPRLQGAYRFENVYFRYDENTPILNGLDLTVEAGETIALVGESGAGKTTVLNLVTGFYLPDGGRLLIDGQEIHDIDLDSYRRHIAMVPQASTMFSGSIRDNIIYGLDEVPSDEKLAEVLEAACLTDVVAHMPKGVDSVIGEKGCTLSGGQRQRVSIARAIIRDPSVIIFDEATSALDTVSEKKIQAAIDNLTRNRTTFIVAHRLSTIRNADHIAVLSAGRCIEYGTYEELMEKKGAFYSLKTLQT